MSTKRPGHSDFLCDFFDLRFLRSPDGHPIVAGHNVHDDPTLMAKTRAVAPAIHDGISLALDGKQFDLEDQRGVGSDGAATLAGSSRAVG